jgi:transposase
MKTEKLKLQGKDKKFLINLTKTGKRNSKEFERAYILLALDKEKRHEEIEDFYNVSRITIWRVKKKYKRFGAKEAIKEDIRSGQPPKYKEKEKAEIVALACTKAPEGRIRWTLSLLEKALKQRKGLKTINRETIRLTLKKTNVNLG